MTYLKIKKCVGNITKHEFNFEITENNQYNMYTSIYILYYTYK